MLTMYCTVYLNNSYNNTNKLQGYFKSGQREKIRFEHSFIISENNVVTPSRVPVNGAL